MFAEGEVFDVIKGAGELDSLLDKECQRVLLARVNLLDVHLIDVSVQPGLGQSGDEELRLVFFDELGRVVELKVWQPKLSQEYKIETSSRSQLKCVCGLKPNFQTFSCTFSYI